MNIKDHIRGVPDFPKPGILFYDISTLLANAGAWRYTIDKLAEAIEKRSGRPGPTCWRASSPAAFSSLHPSHWNSASASR